MSEACPSYAPLLPQAPPDAPPLVWLLKLFQFSSSAQVGPGESSDEQEVLFRFRSVRKMSALCFGVLGVGRRSPPSTDPPDNGKGRRRVRSMIQQTK